MQKTNWNSAKLNTNLKKWSNFRRIAENKMEINGSKLDAMLKCKTATPSPPKEEEKDEEKQLLPISSATSAQSWEIGAARIKKASVLYQVSHAPFGKGGIWDPRININSPERMVTHVWILHGENESLHKQNDHEEHFHTVDSSGKFNS